MASLSKRFTRPAGQPLAPILAAISRHQAALVTLDESCRRADEVAAEEDGRTVTDADLAAQEAANDAEAAALADVLASPLASPSDLRALVEWAGELHDAGTPDVAARALSAIRASPLLFG